MMRIRTVYQKVKDLQKAKDFWEAFLGMAPSKVSKIWCEFKLENINFALLLADDPLEQFSETNCVPVFEFKETEIPTVVAKARSLGCELVFDGLDDPDIQSVVFFDPFGYEFEISKVH
jgi:catechol 2,3-dioxygenase-like lactoylglutathione lyase family enzyme